MKKQLTTQDLNRRLFQAMDSGTIAERNSIARAGAVMIASKQLEIAMAGALTEPVLLAELPDAVQTA